MGTELAVACETLNLSTPKPGQVAIWLLDKMAFGSNDPQIIHEDEDTATNLLERIRLGKRLQTFSLKRGIELPQGEEFDIWLGRLYSDAAIATVSPEGNIAQELVATCQILGLQLPEKGKLQEWLRDLIVRSPLLKQANSTEQQPKLNLSSGESSFTENNLALLDSQPFLDYLLTLDVPPTEDEEYNIAHRFGLEPAHLKKLISRMKFDKLDNK